ncbi:MAG: hypothetical protein AAF845_00120 [Bacteroidota bacterium]
MRCLPGLHRSLTLLALAIAPLAALAQTGPAPDDTTAAERARDAERRFAFAEGYGGASALSSAESADVPGFDAPGRTSAAQLAFGGLHFWGHADFYVRFTTLSRSTTVGDQTLINIPTVETGARAYPWATQPGTVRPFVGTSWTVETVRLGDGPFATLHRFPLEAGLTARLGPVAVDGSVRYAAGREVDVPLSRTEPGTVSIPSWSALVGARVFFESTALNEAGVASGAEARRERRLREAGRLSGVLLSIGPSSAIPLRNSPRNDESFFLSALSPAVFPEFGAGYYHDGLDAFVNLAYRRITTGQDAFGASQRLSRNAATLEAAKILGDYEGFVPFLGAGASVERLTARETDGGEETFVETQTTVVPSVLFGWDIRPTRTQPWLLRTNLRYAPGLSLADGGFRFDQLEFNFIQFVWHVGR